MIDISGCYIGCISRMDTSDGYTGLITRIEI